VWVERLGFLAATEVRLMIKGKLRGLGREPTNVQVLVSPCWMSLLEKGEEFLSIPVKSESNQPLDRGEQEDGSSNRSESGD